MAAACGRSGGILTRVPAPRGRPSCSSWGGPALCPRGNRLTRPARPPLADTPAPVSHQLGRSARAPLPRPQRLRYLNDRRTEVLDGRDRVVEVMEQRFPFRVTIRLPELFGVVGKLLPPDQ